MPYRGDLEKLKWFEEFGTRDYYQVIIRGVVCVMFRFSAFVVRGTWNKLRRQRRRYRGSEPNALASARGDRQHGGG